MPVANYNLPPLEGAYVVEEDQYIEISMDSESLQYHIKYPSGMFKDVTLQELYWELERFITHRERIEEIVRYATNWRRTVLFPHKGRKGLGLQYIQFPNGTIMYGGAGNSFRGFNPFEDN